MLKVRGRGERFSLILLKKVGKAIQVFVHDFYPKTYTYFRKACSYPAFI